jgi:hypothetical protein
MQLTLQPKHVARPLFGAVLTLTLIHSVVLFFFFSIPDDRVYGLVDLFDLDVEGNIPTFYSALAMLFSAVLLWFIAHLPRRARDGTRAYWMGLSAVMAFLAIDEAVVIHENVGDLLERYIVAEGFLYFLWVIPYGIASLVLAGVYFRFVWALPTATRRYICAAGSMYLTGAIGIEMFGAFEADLHGTASILYCVLYTCEEFLEMTGIVVFIYGLLSHVALEGETLSITLISPFHPSVTHGRTG